MVNIFYIKYRASNNYPLNAHGRSVGIVRSRTQTMELKLMLNII
jgi:hypothetical protein